MSKLNINEFDTFIFDMDGTLYLGGVEIPGASKLIKLLQDKGKNVFVITNNSSKKADTYQQKLAKINMNFKNEEVINSTTSLIKWIERNNLSNKKFHIFGTKEMREQMTESGIKHFEDGEMVIVGNHTEFDWNGFVKVSQLIQDGADYIVSNPDLRMPLKDGYYSPDAGLIAQMIEGNTNKKPLIFLGKPQKEMIEPFIKGKTILFGDRIYTDMQCAKNANIYNCLVLSGEATKEDAKQASVEIDFIAENVGEVYKNNKEDK